MNTRGEPGLLLPSCCGTSWELVPFFAGHICWRNEMETQKLLGSCGQRAGGRRKE